MELVYELRIGNLVSKSLKSGNGRTLIDKVGPQDIVRIYENISHFNYHPIKLTQEWLSKFGFEKSDHDSGGYKWHNGMFYVLELAKDAFYCDYTLIFSVDYIHQIQNLYFILTGKELTYSDVI